MFMIHGQLTISQEADSCSDEEFQDLTFHIKDAGDGPYIVLETKEFAIETNQKLQKVIDALKEVCRRAEELANVTTSV